MDETAAGAAPQPTGGWRALSLEQPRGRLVAAAICALLALGAVWRGASLAAERRGLERLAREAEIAELAAPAIGRIATEFDPAIGRLVLSRALLAYEFDARRFRNLSPSELGVAIEESKRRQQLADRLARQALRELPSSWEAPMVIGAVTFLRQLRERDRQIYERPETWERPLRLARERARAFGAPSQLLTAAYLEVWPALPPGERGPARVVLRDAFLDPETFARFFPAWSRLARTRSELYEPLPDRTETWQSLAAYFAGERDWTGFLDASARLSTARRRSLDALREDARSRKRLGDLDGSRKAFVALAQRTRPDLEELPWFESAVLERPPGPIGDALSFATRAWLDWAEALCLVRPCPVTEEVFARLAATATGLFPRDVAVAHLLAGDLAAAELRERREEAQWSESWAPFLVLKSRALLARGEVDKAATALAQVHRNWRRRLPLQLARAEVQRAGGELPRQFALEPSDELRREAWESTDWIWRGEKMRLELLPRHSASGLRLALAEVPERGAVLEVQWNGRTLPPHVARRGGEWRLEIPVRAEPSLLQLSAIAGGSVRPGAVDLASAR